MHFILYCSRIAHCSLCTLAVALSIPAKKESESVAFASSFPTKSNEYDRRWIRRRQRLFHRDERGKPLAISRECSRSVPTSREEIGLRRKNETTWQGRERRRRTRRTKGRKWKRRVRRARRTGSRSRWRQMIPKSLERASRLVRLVDTRSP